MESPEKRALAPHGGVFSGSRDGKLIGALERAWLQAGRRSRAAAWVGSLLGALSVSAPAAASPQGNVSLQAGVAGEGERGDLWHSTRFYGGVRGDVLFGRERNADLGLGPYLDVSTFGFDDVRLGGGGSLHLPVHPYVPAVLSLGGYAKADEGAWEPGVAADLFIGARSYNFHSAYVMAMGVSLGVRYGLGDSHEASVILALNVDSSALWLPAMFIASWLKGSPSE